MKVMTASEVSRAFSAVLDEAEDGETIVITRGGRQIATISPTSTATWGAFREALQGWTPHDDPTIAADVRAARDVVIVDGDPWQSE